MLKGYRQERGLWWPEGDTECARVVFDTLDDCDAAVRLCAKRRTVIQAGGNCGVWPLHLAKLFDRVISFEPDPVNFRALVVNTAETKNIMAVPAALGNERGGFCGLWRIDGNCGAHQVGPGHEAPRLRIDDMKIEDVDLIYLDIEGMEYDAIEGACLTIQKYRPVIAFEDKGLSERYGVKQGETEDMLADLGYRVAKRHRRDVIMVHEDGA